MLATRRPFVVIEKSQEALDAWLDRHPGSHYLHADAADDEALRRAGLPRPAGVFAVTTDGGHSLMVALSVKLLASLPWVVCCLHDILEVERLLAG